MISSTLVSPDNLIPEAQQAVSDGWRWVFSALVCFLKRCYFRAGGWKSRFNRVVPQLTLRCSLGFSLLFLFSSLSLFVAISLSCTVPKREKTNAKQNQGAPRVGIREDETILEFLVRPHCKSQKRQKYGKARENRFHKIRTVLPDGLD